MAFRSGKFPTLARQLKPAVSPIMTAVLRMTADGQQL
jgi:hypothetical protein